MCLRSHPELPIPRCNSSQFLDNSQVLEMRVFSLSQIIKDYQSDSVWGALHGHPFQPLNLHCFNSKNMLKTVCNMNMNLSQHIYVNCMKPVGAVYPHTFTVAVALSTGFTCSQSAMMMTGGGLCGTCKHMKIAAFNASNPR